MFKGNKFIVFLSRIIDKETQNECEVSVPAEASKERRIVSSDLEAKKDEKEEEEETKGIYSINPTRSTACNDPST